ncbi:MAG: hypothetical protein ACM3MG_07025 [Bacillota bacterium]
MKFVSIFIIIAVVQLSAPMSLAQSSLEGFQTGRYEVHKSTKKSRHPSSVTEDPPVASAPKVVEPEKLPAAVENPVAPVAVPPVAPKTEEPAKAVEPGISEQAQSLFSNQVGKINEFYREQIHPDDVRNNKLEIEFAPMAIYNDSHSNYSFRNYNSYFNAVKLKANLWFTPLIGISGKFMFSMGADVDANDGSNSRVTAKYEFMDLGINFRKFFGTSRMANSLEFSLLYSDDKTKMPSDATGRVNIKSSGVGLGLKARFPTSASYAWAVGGSFFPRLQHRESEAGAVISSGASEENTRMSFDFGGEWIFSRENQLIWALGVTTEKNLFDGAAATPDPSTGSTPSNVSVTNSLYMFSLGYRWGH